jgi:precorrin-2 dehydrogenase/sirohydrochlorin ferrochelatase
MNFLPISINITDKKILIIGGGKVACHKIKCIQQFSNNIFVIALEVNKDIKAKGIPYVEKPYEKSDLKGAFLVYACTNIIELNSQIKTDTESLGILTNVVDNPVLCDFISPAIFKRENYTIAVGSNAENVNKSIAIRDKIKEILENDPSIFSKPE